MIRYWHNQGKVLRIENFSEYFSSWIYNSLNFFPWAWGTGALKGSLGKRGVPLRSSNSWLFLGQKLLTSLDFNQLIGCLQTSTRCFIRRKISSPHAESCVFTITDFRTEARKQNHILQDFWTAAYWTRLSKISWFVSCKAKNSSARQRQITIFCDNRVQ